MCDIFDSSDSEEDAPRGKQIFFPALSTQRYNKVIGELLRHEEIIDKVVDFGCNEGKFLKRAKQQLRRVSLFVGVDLDKSILEICAENVKPPEDTLQKLDYPLRVKLYAGNIAQYDRRLEGVDAVVAIELIEHLNYRTLHKFPEVIFGKLQPYVVILTTPNVEYNVVFDMGERRFRHDDHKFEWTRAQFQEWCDEITAKYSNYWVKFMGVGDPPIDKKEIGFCTQMAVFRMKRVEYLALRNSKRVVRRAEREQFSEPGYSSEFQDLETDASILQPYKLAYDIKFPTKASEAREGRMLLEMRYYCQYLMEFRNIPLENVNGALGIWFLLKDLMECPNIKRYLKIEDDMALFLIDQGWMTDLQNGTVFYEHEPPVVIQTSSDNEDEFWTKDNIVLSLSGDDTGVNSMSSNDTSSIASINDDSAQVETTDFQTRQACMAEQRSFMRVFKKLWNIYSTPRDVKQNAGRINWISGFELEIKN